MEKINIFSYSKYHYDYNMRRSLYGISCSVMNLETRGKCSNDTPNQLMIESDIAYDLYNLQNWSAYTDLECIAQNKNSPLSEVMQYLGGRSRENN